MNKFLLVVLVLLTGCTNVIPEDISDHPVKGTYQFVEETEGNLSLVNDEVRVLVYQQFIRTYKLSKDPHYYYRPITILVNKEIGLPSNFVPQDLIRTQVATSPRASNVMIRKDVNVALKALFSAAKEEGVELWFQSGYRSYSVQKQLYERYVKQYGEAVANSFSAKPGHSEHQTGLAIDVTSPNSNSSFEGDFGDSKEGKWLAINAHRFGFIIRYPKDKTEITGYIYEPWHLRYVGVELATTLFESGLVMEELDN
ncbi:MAG: D-alanyl-D-alanine carboxypeptidase [Firmicutes bacterium HGW-Firmicutes-20]|nr:MAG: D-alanyl-D-alanine carboxypeptidase [Firmicutes bacterium HGW-Firmicutes-20]PKM70174.1 MAG: D-alanyl-D-alanine carboxypeptidase [Firmicutes bacterium HGW-Firmicutes-19]